MAGRGRRANDAFTLIELMFTLMLLLVLVGIGVGLITTEINYYKSCGAAEQALWDIRRVVTIAKGRGRGGHPTGIMFFQGQRRAGGGGIDPNGWSYLAFGEGDDVYAYGMDGSPVPPTQITALTARQQGDLVNLPLTVTVVQDGSVAAPQAVAAGTRFELDDAGNPDGNSVAAGYVDLYDPASGYFRLSLWNGRPNSRTSTTYAALSITMF